MAEGITIRDLIYFDFEKAASLFSQLEGGLPDKITESHETSGDQVSKRNYDLLSVIKAEFGEVSSDKHSVIEAKILHHDLFNKIEFLLDKFGMVSNLSNFETDLLLDPEAIHQAIGETPYIKATGWTMFEDYNRLGDVMSNFNDLIEFIQRCSLGELNKEIDKLNVRGKKNKHSKEGKILKKFLDEGKLDDWLIQGLSLWLETFMKDRLHLMIVPFEDCPSVELLCNLKKDCFVDDNLSHILYGYGNRPNIKLSVFGLITSMPPEEENGFNIFNQVSNEVDMDDKAECVEEGEEDGSNKDKFEKAFRSMFPALEGIESFSTFHKYPRIILHPIAVFRDIKGTLPKA